MGVQDRTIVVDFFNYIDDERLTVPTEWECWLASKIVCSVSCFLGLQGEARINTNPSLCTEEEIGTMVTSKDGEFEVLVSKKWERMLNEIREELNRKVLERERGFLIYLSKLYRSMKPYLSGISGGEGEMKKDGIYLGEI